MMDKDEEIIEQHKKLFEAIRRQSTLNRIHLQLMKTLLLLISHYSSKLQVWSWQKLWGDRKTGYGYNKWH